MGNRDGRVALYLTESLAKLLPPEVLSATNAPLSERATKIIDFLDKQGASFFGQIHAGIGEGFPRDTQDALWELVWAGHATNDTFHPLRNLRHANETKWSRAERAEGPPGCLISAAIAIKSFRRGAGARALVSGAPAYFRAVDDNAMDRKHGATIVGPSRRGDARNGIGRKYSARIPYRIPRPQSDGRERVGATWHVCSGNGRRAIRNDSCGGYVAEFTCA